MLNLRPGLPSRRNDFSCDARGALPREVEVKSTMYLAARGLPPAQDPELMTDIAQ